MKKIILFGRGKKAAAEAAPAAQTETAYAARFLKRNVIKKRQCVYISYDVHGIIAGLVRSLVDQGREITVGGYIDTVLKNHLQANRDEINEVYRRRSGDLF